jgi:hypothetical protein
MAPKAFDRKEDIPKNVLFGIKTWRKKTYIT